MWKIIFKAVVLRIYFNCLFCFIIPGRPGLQHPFSEGALDINWTKRGVRLCLWFSVVLCMFALNGWIAGCQNQEYMGCVPALRFV